MEFKTDKKTLNDDFIHISIKDIHVYKDYNSHKNVIHETNLSSNTFNIGSKNKYLSFNKNGIIHKTCNFMEAINIFF